MLTLLRFFLLSLFVGHLAAAQARMYQWLDPDNGTTQLSGKPPVWYRSTGGGPRVFVFENGRIIDDTHIHVSITEQEKLRQQAFLKAEEDKAAAKEKLIRAKKLKAVLDRKQERETGPEASEQKTTEQTAPEDIMASADKSGPVNKGAPKEDSVPDSKAPLPEEATIDKMRELISEWEKLRIEKAKGEIGSAPPALQK
ncbi:MAG: hypothetical protein ACE5GZ_04565 [Gammaproteobacteria bacterium]